MRNLIADLKGRVRSLIRGTAEDDALREELEFHLEMERRRNESSGMSSGDASRAARLRFGSSERWLEESRDARGVRALTDIAQDLGLALREVRRRPAFAFVAVLTLGLGMAGVTAVFSVLNRVLLQPIPGVQASERLVTVRFQEDEWNDTGLSFLNFHEIAQSLGTFEVFAGYTSVQLQVLPDGGRATVLDGVSIVGDYFGALGITPAHGRFFVAEELGAAPANVAVISHRLWRDEYGSSEISGATLRMNGHVFTVVGVAPPGFHGAERLGTTDVWLPPAVYSDLRHFSRPMAGDRSADAYRRFFGRLAPGVTVTQAEQELTLAIDRLRAAYPEVSEQYERNRPRVYAGVGLAPQSRAGVARTMKLMFGVAMVVLLIACANVANLLLFRAVRARGESAVRRALGASTLRILQHHAAQGIVLAAAGASAGLALALLLLRGAGALGMPGVGQVTDVPIDVRVLGFTASLALLTAILFAAVPTLFSRKWDLVTNLREAARAETGRTSWVRNGLVVLQLALSAALVIPAALLARSVQNLNDIDLGFDPDGVYEFYTTVEPQGYDVDQRVQLQQQLLATLRADPSIVSAATTSSPPFAMANFLARVRGPEQEGVEPVLVTNHAVSSGFFSTLSIPFVDPSHAGAAEIALRNVSPDAVVLSRSAAEQIYGSTDAVGRAYVEEGYVENWTRRVVGVVEDIHITRLREPPPPAIYRSMGDDFRDAFAVLVRSRASADRTEAIVTDALASTDPALPFFRVQSLRAGVDRAMAEELLFARLSGVLGLLAAMLAAVGLYALMGYSVAQRRREIGIRMALGARAGRVVMLVTGETVRLTLVGLALGCVGGWALARVLRNMLFGVAPLDPASYVAAAIFFSLIAVLAAAMPARQAASVQPSVALRAE
ncbi:MAG TPA: ADOP family duplicated permease [Longimicrobiales bacterium]|nr:ADOP family duplicated permease [Longimicrobiales bacterium]